MLRRITSRQFEKDYYKAIKSGKKTEKLNNIIERLINQEIVEQNYKDHKLTGVYSGYRECHIEPDWLLIYKIDKENKMISFVRTGSHSELFE